MKYIIYYKTIDDNHRCIFDDDHFETLDYLPDQKECHHFEVFKGYDTTDEGLVKFKSDMIRWNEELKKMIYCRLTISSITRITVQWN